MQWFYIGKGLFFLVLFFLNCGKKKFTYVDSIDFICLGTVIVTKGTLPLGVPPFSISCAGHKGRISTWFYHLLYLGNSLTGWDSPSEVL